MRVLLFTVGSDGDVRPFAALAGRLRAEGHDPVLAAPARYQPLATAAGVAFEPLDLDMTEVGRAVAGRTASAISLPSPRPWGSERAVRCRARPPPRPPTARSTWSSITR